MLTKPSMLALVILATVLPSHESVASDTIEPRLSGKYHVVTTETCVRTPYEVPPAIGFDPDTKALLVDGEAVNAIGEAKAKFHEDGTVQLTAGRQTETSFSSVKIGDIPIVSPSLFTCDGSYTISGRKVSLELNCDVEHPDPSIGIELGPLTFEGKLSRNKKTMSLTNLNRTIQSVTVTIGGTPVQERQRICSQTALFTR